ncbi:MarR family winged helix-turn-helix transcriptional regulator [Lacticaseibacillus sp. GG6-2]
MEFQTPPAVMEALFKLNTLNQQYTTTHLKAYALTIPQARALLYIDAHAKTNQKTLATYLGKQDATVTNLLKALEKRGLVLRKITPNNERQKELTLTPKGTAMVAEVQQIFYDRETKTAVLLTDSEQKQLLTILTRLNAGLGED